MTNKEFALSNLGKEVTFFFGEKPKTCMIVGYFQGKDPKDTSIIVSMPYEFGWRESAWASNDCILIKSPLNVSFWYTGWREISIID